MNSLWSIFWLFCTCLVIAGCDQKPAGEANADASPAAHVAVSEPAKESVASLEAVQKVPDSESDGLADDDVPAQKEGQQNLTPPAPPMAKKDSDGGDGTGGIAIDTDEAKLAETPAGKVLLRLCKFYESLGALSVHVKQVVTVRVGDSEPHSVTSRCDFLAQKPNRIALLRHATGSGPDLFSDGEIFTAYSPTLNRFTEQPAPESFADILETEAAAMNDSYLQTEVLLSLVTEKSFSVWMEGAEAIEDLGEVELDGQKVSLIQLKRSGAVWKLWIDAGDEPWLRQLEIQTPAEPSSPDEAIYTYLLTLTRQAGEIAGLETAFQFQAPVGAVKSESLSLLSLIIGSQPQREREEAPHPLIGTQAPEVELQSLTGEIVKLSDYQGQKVIMLDFWATWCPPCVRELPILTEVAAEFENRDVLFLAANQGEDAETIKEFLEKSQLNFKVLLDTDHEAGGSYRVRGIPQLVLIDKQGKIQAVHIGYSPTIGETLRRELNAILEGTDLAEAALEKHRAKMETKQAALPRSDGLKLAWSHPTQCTSAVVLPSGEICVASQEKILALSKDRSEFREIATISDLSNSDLSKMRLARRSASGEMMLIVFTGWGEKVSAIGLDGSLLWEEEGGDGIDDVFVADLSGDGIDEIIVGYNGGTGLHVFDANGNRLWKYTDIGNVWTVTAGNVTGDEHVEVVTTSASGNVHIFSADGKPLKTINVPAYSTIVRTGKLAPSDPYETIFVVGSGDSSEKTVALNGDGNILWELAYPLDGKHCRSADICTNFPYLAQVLNDDVVTVIDLRTGEFVGSVVIESSSSGELLWLPTTEADSRPQLLVASSEGLRIYDLNETDAQNTGDNAAASSPEN